MLNGGQQIADKFDSSAVSQDPFLFGRSPRVDRNASYAPVRWDDRYAEVRHISSRTDPAAFADASAHLTPAPGRQPGSLGAVRCGLGSHSAHNHTGIHEEVDGQIAPPPSRMHGASRPSVAGANDLPRSAGHR